MHTEVCTHIQIKLAGVSVQLLATYSQPASTQTYSLASNLCYDYQASHVQNVYFNTHFHFN